MSPSPMTATPTEPFPPFLISRSLAAPRELVWRAWTEPAHLLRWWGPKGFAVLSCEVDLRPGGLFLYHLRAPDGQDMWGRFVYREIAPPERLVFIVSFSDAQAGVTRHPWSPTWPLQVLSTVTFVEERDGTLLTVRWTPWEAAAEELATFDAGRDSMRQGWTGTLDQLEAHLAGAAAAGAAQQGGPR